MLIPIDIERTLRAIRETFRDLAAPQDPGFEERLEAAAAEGGIVDARGAAPKTVLPPLPAALWPRRPLPAMTASEVVAYDLLAQHLFSRTRIAADGLLDEYLALDIPTEVESRWRGDFINRLIEACGECPECLAPVLELAAEYRVPRAVERVLDAMDDAASDYRAPDGVLLGECLAILDALDGNAPGDGDEVRLQALELARRLSLRLAESEPEGAWRDDWAAVRARFEHPDAPFAAKP